MENLKVGSWIFTKNDSEFDVKVTKINGSRVTVEWEDEDNYDTHTSVVNKSAIYNNGHGFELPNWSV